MVRYRDEKEIVIFDMKHKFRKHKFNETQIQKTQGDLKKKKVKTSSGRLATLLHAECAYLDKF